MSTFGRGRVARCAAAAGVMASGALPGASVAAVASGSCPTMTLEGTTSLALKPSSVTVDAGACVEFVNATSLTATFTVGRYQQQVASGDHTSGSRNYPATAAGTTQKVTASELLGSAHGSIVIRSAARHTSSPAATRSSSPQPQQQPPPRPVSSVAPSPTRAPTLVVPTVSPPPSSAVTSAPASSPFLAGRPTPASSPTHAVVVSGPLQPPTGRGTGLPAALAALAVVATAGALLRVLLAEPVEAVDARRRSVRPAL